MGARKKQLLGWLYSSLPWTFLSKSALLCPLYLTVIASDRFCAAMKNSLLYGPDTGFFLTNKKCRLYRCLNFIEFP